MHFHSPNLQLLMFLLCRMSDLTNVLFLANARDLVSSHFELFFSPPAFTHLYVRPRLTRKLIQLSIASDILSLTVDNCYTDHIYTGVQIMKGKQCNLGLYRKGWLYA